MCVIAVCQTRKLTPYEINLCWYNNPDGAGMGFLFEDQHSYLKGFMTQEQFTDLYQYVDMLPHIVHFRIASSGGINKNLTHPFVCEEESPLHLNWSGDSPVLFQNGTISRWTKLAEMIQVGPEKIILDENWSDSRVMACLVANTGSDLFLKYESKGSKFVLIQDRAIKTYGEFEEADGILFSNESYRKFLYEDYWMWIRGKWVKGRRKIKEYNIKGNKNKKNDNSTTTTNINTGLSLCV